MSNTNKFSTILLAGVGMLALAGAVEARELRGWNLHTADYPGSIAMEAFAEAIDEATDGRYTGSVYHDGQLGDQRFAIEQIAFDGIDFAVFSSGSLGDVAPLLQVVGLPYIFRSSEHMFNVVDGEIGDRLSDALSDNNMVALSWFDGGSRSFYTKDSPVQTPADLVGRKIRVPDAEIFVATAEALGANATPLAFGEVYTSLQTGVIDGAENNMPSFESTRDYEVVDYYSRDEHLMVPEALVVSRTLWESLSPEDQEAFQTAADEAAAMQRELWSERVAEAEQVVRDAGVEIVEIEDKQPFIDAMSVVYERFADSEDSAALVEQIQAVED